MANKYWIGAADNSKQLDTITATGTWATGDTATITCNNKTVTVTIGSSVATTDVVEALASAINAADATSDLANDESRNRGGRELGEFRDMDASASGSVLTLTSATAGVPFTVTRSEVTAGSGALGAVTSVAVATGKHFADNANNWSGGIASTGDTQVFSDGNIDCLYGLSQSDVAGFSRLGAYSGNIGLARTNTTHSGFTYPEYRARPLDVKSTTGYCQIYIGDGTGNSTGRTVIETSQGSFRIEDTAPASASGLNPIEISSTTSTVILVVFSGNIDAGTRGEGGNITFESIQQSGGNVRFEGLVDTSSTMHMTGGTFVTDLTMSNFTAKLQLDGGTMVLRGTSNCAPIIVNGGILDYQAGAIVTAEIRDGGTMTLDNDSEAKAVTDIKLHKGAAFRDSFGVGIPSGDYQFIACEPSDVALSLPKNMKYSPTEL